MRSLLLLLLLPACSSQLEEIHCDSSSCDEIEAINLGTQSSDNSWGATQELEVGRPYALQLSDLDGAGQLKLDLPDAFKTQVLRGYYEGEVVEVADELESLFVPAPPADSDTSLEVILSLDGPEPSVVIGVTFEEIDFGF